MSKSQAKQAVTDNPQKADQLAKALGQAGVPNPNKTVQQHPRRAAQQVSGVLSIGNSSANGSAQNNSSAGGQVKLQKCSGGGFIDSAMCKAKNALFGWVIGGVVDFVQGIISGIVNVIVGTPVPKHNESPAIFQPPTNQPMKGVYNSWLTFSMPLGVIEWILMVLGILFSQVFISGSSEELKRREMKSRSWKVLLGVLGSWAIGAAILHLSNGITLAVAPNGEDIASNLAVFAGNIGAAGAAGLLLWFFEGVLFLFILLLVLSKYAVVFVMMWSLPILLPLAAFNVGPIKILSKPARGIIDMFIPFVFLTLPMALVLRVGYVVVNSMNQDPIAQAGMHFSGANTLLILGFWIMAAVSPLFVFSHTGRIKGMAAGMLGASLATSNIQEKVQDAKERVDTNPPPNVSETTDINPDGNDGEFGGPLPNGNDRPSMLEAGTNQDLGRAEDSSLAETEAETQSPHGWASDATAPETDEAGDPELPPGGGGATASGWTTNTANGSGTTSGVDPVSAKDITQVQHPRDLPSGTKYRMGHLKDNGEFQPSAFNKGQSRSMFLNGGYNRLNNRTERYEDEKLLLQSQEDGSFYDLDSMTYREQSYEQMSRDTSEKVLNS
ncbi:hypothetical protein [Halococcus thailandensis]|uniref:Uncharacterized protein n=1 Tax=Halococcus thailandensis JCM 13552 TaxID=1227457 RepID=M0NFZ2_9EURY|nr:hypothetical protein [Halococcus thailandensis]EMA56468.1 hypothetical protein C451_02048 [Halococcus thailandensis JCM 13552]